MQQNVRWNKYHESIIRQDQDNRYYANLKILGVDLVGLLDGGAQLTVIGKKFGSIINRLKLRTAPGTSSIVTADQTAHNIELHVELPIAFNGIVRVIKAAFVPSLDEFLILGMDFWDTFSIKPAICTLKEFVKVPPVTVDHTLDAIQSDQLNKVLQLIPFSKDGELSKTHLTTHVIDTADAKPIKQRHYVISPFVQAQVNAEIDRLLALKVIEPCTNSPWCNPIVAVVKPDKIRICLDARKLNSVTIKDAYPQQQINRILSRISNTKYLSSLDFSDAFLQVPLDENSKPKTAFAVSGKGFYCYNRMAFGLCNSGATLCRLVDQIIGCDLEPSVFVYLDDIIIATETFAEHIEILKIVALRIKQSGLTISVKKSKFCTRQLNYLGYVVDQDGIRPDPEKISAMTNYPTPHSVKDVRRLLGLVGWYRRFIPNFSNITAPISDLLKKSNSKFVWNVNAENAFKQLKQMLVSDPILTCPDYSKPFIIQSDASDSGIGGILVQGEGEEERVIAYMSEKLSLAQKKYQTTEKECLAVIRSMEKFRPYIEGTKFTVITDHASLLWLMNLKDSTGRVGRWALRLQAYNFELKHRKGKHMVVADALSRAVYAITSAPSDPWYDGLKQKIIENPQKYAQFQIKDNLIYKYCSRKNLRNGFLANWKMVVEYSNRQEVIHTHHDLPTSAHQGFFKTINKIKQNYYWPNMDADIRKYVSNCEVCKASKPSNKLKNAPMGSQRKTERPWQILQIDFIGPLPRSKRGFSYLLVVVDTFSKFVRLCPLRNATSKSTIKFLEEEVFLLFGVPEIIISDNGSQFTSTEFAKFIKSYGVKHWFTAAYHPQANASEAANKTIGIAIRSYVQDNRDHRNWDENIPKIACALNSAIHTSTKCTPYVANFGLNMCLNPNLHSINPNQETEDKIDKMNTIRKEIIANLEKAYVMSKKQYNLRARPVSYGVGEEIWMETHVLSDAIKGISAKLAPKYTKCIVTKLLGSNTYELKDQRGYVYKKVSASNIKR